MIPVMKIKDGRVTLKAQSQTIRETLAVALSTLGFCVKQYSKSEYICYCHTTVYYLDFWIEEEQNNDN